MQLRRCVCWRVINLLFYVPPPNGLLLASSPMMIILDLLKPNLLRTLSLLVLPDHTDVFSLVAGGVCLRIINFLHI